MKEGSVVAAAFPQSDGRYKLRPAVVLRFVKPHGDMLLAAVSTQLHQTVGNLDEIVSPDDEDAVQDEALDPVLTNQFPDLEARPRELANALTRFSVAAD